MSDNSQTHIHGESKKKKNRSITSIGIFGKVIVDVINESLLRRMLKPTDETWTVEWMIGNPRH